MKTLKSLGVLALAALVLTPGSARAGHATVDLGVTGSSFAVLAASTVTNTGPTVVNGNLGVSPGNAVVGFSPGNGVVNGTIHAGDATAAQAQSDLTAAYNSAAGRACNTILTGQDLGGLTLTPGVYCFSSSAQLTGALTLNGQGDPNAVFIFQIGTTLTTASGSSVLLINGTQACNVFWQVGSSATLGTTTSFRGNILANQSITANTNATVVDGRLLARNGAVTLDTNTISFSACSHPPAPAVTPTPTPTITTGPPASTTTPTTGATTAGGRRRTGRATGAAGAGAGAEGGELPRTGERLPTEPTLALGISLILSGILYNFLGGSSSTLALALRGYEPKRRVLGGRGSPRGANRHKPLHRAPSRRWSSKRRS